MNKFLYKIDESDLPYFKVSFEGEITGGTQIFSDEIQKLLKDIKKKSESKVILFNLSRVTFWDSEGMRQILGTVNEINTIKDKRAYVLAPKSGYLFDRAKEKYKDQLEKTIHWIEEKSNI